MKKPSLRVSDLHLQSVTEERAALMERVGTLLRLSEHRKTSLSTAQCRQLNHALDCIAEGLFSLAGCELDDFIPPRRRIDFSSQDMGHSQRPEMPVSTTQDTQPNGDGAKPISLAALRRKLNQMNEAERKTLHGKTER